MIDWFDKITVFDNWDNAHDIKKIGLGLNIKIFTRVLLVFKPLSSIGFNVSLLDDAVALEQRD